MCPGLVDGGGGGEVGGLGKTVDARVVRRAEAEAGGGGGPGLEPRLAIKNPTQKNPLKMFFFCFFFNFKFFMKIIQTFFLKQIFSEHIRHKL